MYAFKPLDSFSFLLLGKLNVIFLMAQGHCYSTQQYRDLRIYGAVGPH